MGNGGNHHRILFFPGNLPLRRLLEGVGGPRPSDMLFSAGFHRGQNQRKRREKKKRRNGTATRTIWPNWMLSRKITSITAMRNPITDATAAKVLILLVYRILDVFPTAGAPVFSIFMNTPGLQVGHSLFAVGAKRQLIFHIPSSFPDQAFPFRFQSDWFPWFLNNPSVSIGWKRKSD